MTEPLSHLSNGFIFIEILSDLSYGGTKVTVNVQ